MEGTVLKPMREHEKLERDSLAGERTCANEVCGCVLPQDSPTDYCGEYCKGEGDRGEGACQCGHSDCT